MQTNTIIVMFIITIIQLLDTSHKSVRNGYLCWADSMGNNMEARTDFQSQFSKYQVLN